MKSLLGIWLDLRQADVISLRNDEERSWTIPSEVDTSTPKGGSHSNPKWGIQDAISEQKYLNRKKQQLKEYFELIANACEDYDFIYIFGPAETKDHLQQHLMSKSEFKPMIIGVDTADQMTPNQKSARVREVHASL